MLPSRASPKERLIAEWLAERSRFIGSLIGLTDEKVETAPGQWTYRAVAKHVLAQQHFVLLALDAQNGVRACAAGSANPRRRGATLAVHSMAGYAGGFVGPLMLGWILDLSGGMSSAGWGLALLHVAAVALVGQIAFTALQPRDLAGDQPLSAASTRARCPR